MLIPRGNTYLQPTSVTILCLCGAGWKWLALHHRRLDRAVLRDKVALGRADFGTLSFDSISEASPSAQSGLLIARRSYFSGQKVIPIRPNLDPGETTSTRKDEVRRQLLDYCNLEAGAAAAMFCCLTVFRCRA